MNGLLLDKKQSRENLSKKASLMYQMLSKIASNKEVWTLHEVRELLSNISNRKEVTS